MAPKTVQELRANAGLLTADNSRYNLYAQQYNTQPTADLPSLLLLLRNVNNIPNGNRDRVLNQIRVELGENNRNLTLAGVDRVNGQNRDLYSNRRGEEFLNQVDAGILTAISKGQALTDILNEGTHVADALAKHLNYDYPEFYGSRQVAINEIVKWASLYMSTRANNISRMVRNVDSLPAGNQGQRTHFAFRSWKSAFNDQTPMQNYPPIRDPPNLAEESEAQGVPRNEDGGGPGSDEGDDDNNNDDNNNDDNNNDDNNNNNNDGNDGNTGGNNTGAGAGAGAGAGGAGGPGNRPNPRRPGYWNYDNNNNNQRWDVPNWRSAVTDSVSICDRCVQIYAGYICPNCTDDSDDSILSPTQRVQSLIRAETIIDTIRDRIQEALQEMSGTVEDQVNVGDLLHQLGPEFLIHAG
ncbi:hypothetical protein F4859DRAFT_523280 [Xylaria cf. heliscus]|nr:hypothetical protein F4859DRAFT_523280 [Xylaria cf. heliscus]